MYSNKLVKGNANIVNNKATKKINKKFMNKNIDNKNISNEDINYKNDNNSLIPNLNKNIENTTNRLIQLHKDGFNSHKAYMDIFRFKFQASVSVKEELLKYAINIIFPIRRHFINELTKYIPLYLAYDLENGILEYSLITVTNDKLMNDFVLNIYSDKFSDICKNLDINNKNINNKTLLPNLLGGHIKPSLVAFMRPEQLHPVRWKNELDKYNVKQNIYKDIKVTDIYKCFKCGERKCKSTQMQTRSADEPMTIFITCLVCYNTFTK